MNQKSNLNSTAIIILCSHLCKIENVKPFEPVEWSKFADVLLDNKVQPHEILSFSADDFKSSLNLTEEEILRIKKLTDRSRSITFEIEKYANMGINIMTRADCCYPKILKKKLGKSCPPIFYYAGNPEIADKKYVGFAGSRSADANDDRFTADTAAKVNSNGYAVVSGGAKGVDSKASAVSIKNGNFCIEYISDSLINKINSKNIIDAVINNQLLILSAAKPDAGFSTGIAMMRNKLIYAQSDGTVIVKSDYKKGGTWSGAVENLNKCRSVTFCWNNADYNGNMELIKMGAFPIDKEWDGDVSKYELDSPGKKESPEQLSLFDG